MKAIKIKEIYTGKPDAKDEINFEGLSEFIKTYVVAEHFNIESLITGNNCFITGFKGTGKTALLFYLENELSQRDESTCSSFIFFKEEFTEVKRKELEGIAKRVLSSISIQQDALVQNNEFEYIWRWLLFKRIVADNEAYSENLFVNDESWKEFEKKVNTIKEPQNQRKFVIPKKIKMAAPYTDLKTQTKIAPEIEVDLQNPATDDYRKFLNTIDEIEDLFGTLTRTDIPYYIFIDELEAYYGDISIFKRDLCLIRDLLFTVKRFNSIFSSVGMKKTKLVCSVRSEILTAISRFIVTKELNKITSGFSLPLIWNYSNTSSYMHPIIQILLKRVAVCEEAEEIDYKEIYDRWLPEKIHGIEPANYILNNSWCKPRDIVRLLVSAQNSVQNNNDAFSQAVFNSIVKTYSEESLTEIKEELCALYTSEQIDIIINCFMGYKTAFSVSQLRERVSTYFSNTVLDTQFIQVIDDLYRLGFLGNFLPVSKIYRWQHKGDGRVILSEEWRLVVHFALHGALSLGGKQDYGQNRGELPQIGDVAHATVKKVIRSFVLVEFKHYGEVYDGCVHISEFTKLGYGYIPNLRNIVRLEEEYKVVLKEFSEEYQSWRLQLVIDGES